MTSRERIVAALEHREPDRTPIFEYVLMSPVEDQILGRRGTRDSRCWQELISEQGWENAVRQIAVDLAEIAQTLGHDMIYSIPGPARPKESSPSSGTEQHVPLPDDPVERIRRGNAWAASADPKLPEESLFLFVLLKEEMEKRELDLPILAPAWNHGVWTNVDLMQTMLLAPEVAHEHFAQATRRSLAFIDQYAGLGMDIIGVGGDFAGNRPLISPALYAQFIMPEVKKCSRRIHELGLWSVNASDGDLWSVIEDFLLGCEVDGFIEIDQQAGMDLKTLKERFGDRITLFGNMDCGNVLSFGSQEEIKRKTIECLEAGMGNGGHIFSASNAITASVPLENYMTMVNTYRDFFALARLRVC